MKDGTFILQVMYFGLMNALPFFQRMMHRDFRELLQRYPENLGNYMDDWWIATESTPEGVALQSKNRTQIPGPNGEEVILLKSVQNKIRRAPNGDPWVAGWGGRNPH